MLSSGGARFRLFYIMGIPVDIGIFTFILVALYLLPIGEQYGLAAGAGVAIGVLISILIHEIAHALVGTWVGARVVGIQLDLLGGATLFSHKPPSYFKDILISIVGPGSNFVLWFILQQAANAVPVRGSDGGINALFVVLYYLSNINLFLGIFNILPCYPLDGGQAAFALIVSITKRERLAAGIMLVFSCLLAAWLVFGNGVGGLGLGNLFAIFIAFWLVSSSIALFTSTRAPAQMRPTPRQEAERLQRESEQRARSHKGHPLFEQGRAHLLAREFPQAIDAFTQALQLEPNELSYLDYRAYTFAQMGAYPQALADYNYLLSQMPQRDDYYSARAAIYQKMGNFDLAYNDVQIALQINSTNGQALELKRELSGKI